MRLIDADSLFNWGKFKLSDAVKNWNETPEQQSFSYSTLMMYEIADEIADAPTVEPSLASTMEKETEITLTEKEIDVVASLLRSALKADYLEQEEYDAAFDLQMRISRVRK